MRITDTMLVAALMHHDVAELITCDPRDFAIFDEVRVIDPRAQS